MISPDRLLDRCGFTADLWAGRAEATSAKLANASAHNNSDASLLRTLIFLDPHDIKAMHPGPTRIDSGCSA